MSRGPWNFKPAVLNKALAAARSAGFDVARVKVSKDGGFEIDFGKPATEAAPAGDVNEWDDVGQSRGHP